jgi:hypothetical protein
MQDNPTTPQTILEQLRNQDATLTNLDLTWYPNLFFETQDMNKPLTKKV